MNMVARIKAGYVINIEVADDEWIAANQGIDDCIFVKYDDPNFVDIGYLWSEETGFVDPSLIGHEG